ncbi:MAG: ABC transporter substrate-binding protein [Candidatus Sulfotelmatobacter sp.]
MTACHTPRRIACLQPSATVILVAIGELDRVVACTKYCAEVVPEIASQAASQTSSKPSSQPRMILHDSWTSNSAEIIAAQPDLVIASVPYQEKAVIEILRSGARFLGLAPRTLADIYEDIALIAGAVGAFERGQQAIASMQERIDKISQEVAAGKPAAPRPSVFCEEWGKPLITSQPWVAELVEAAGGQFIGSPGKQISADEVERLNPEVMVAAWCGAGDRVPLEKIIADRRWQATRAAQTGRIYCIRDEYLNTPAPTLMQGLEALASAIHPDLFVRTKGIRQITAVPFAGL